MAEREAVGPDERTDRQGARRIAPVAARPRSARGDRCEPDRLGFFRSRRENDTRLAQRRRGVVEAGFVGGERALGARDADRDGALGEQLEIAREVALVAAVLEAMARHRGAPPPAMRGVFVVRVERDRHTRTARGVDHPSRAASVTRADQMDQICAVGIV